MSQSLARLLVHLVFSTKNRVALLQSQQLRSEVHAYLTATLRALDCEPLQVGGVSDHVHLLFALSRTVSLADVVKQLKTSSTKTIREKVIMLSVGKLATEPSQ
jgi:putative transposase